jgi:Ser/Thr protein kinase RdoA (MazF antagonist)
MMHVNTMGLVIDDLERVGSCPIPDACASAWQPDAGSLQIFRVSSNFIFRFRQGGVSRFLRFAHESERTRSEIDAELRFVLHCASAGVAVARPLPSSTGRLIEDVTTDAGIFHAVVFEKAAGKPLVAEELEESVVRAWGAAVARIHVVSQTLTSEVALARRSWETDVENTRRLLASEASEIRNAFEANVRRLDSLPTDPSGFGLIHFDLATDNVFRNGDQICAIDFDDAARYWYAADIAFALDWSGDEEPLERIAQRLRWLVAGYRLERPMDADWLDHVPDFVRLEAHLKLGRLLRSYHDADPSDDLKWLAAMRPRHEAMIEGLRSRCSGSWPEIAPHGQS